MAVTGDATQPPVPRLPASRCRSGHSRLAAVASRARRHGSERSSRARSIRSATVTGRTGRSMPSPVALSATPRESSSPAAERAGSPTSGCSTNCSRQGSSWTASAAAAWERWSGALFAAGLDPDEIEAELRAELVERNPMSDYTIPLAALVRGPQGRGDAAAPVRRASDRGARARVLLRQQRPRHLGAGRAPARQPL